MQHVYCKFDLQEKFIPKLEGAKHINGGKGRDEVFLECGDGTLGRFAQWLCGGTSWMLIALDRMYFLTASEHSLSITFSAGW